MVRNSQNTLIAFILAILTIVETVDAFGQSAGFLVLVLIAIAWVVLGISADRLYVALYGSDSGTTERPDSSE